MEKFELNFIIKIFCNSLVIWLLWGWFGAGVVGPSLSFSHIIGLYMMFLLLVGHQETKTISFESNDQSSKSSIANIFVVVLTISFQPSVVLVIGYIAKMCL